MLCGAPNQDDVAGLAQCLMQNWDLQYTIYFWLHYGLGALGVLLPILATILSDLESKKIRRAITGSSAIVVAVYAFLSPNEHMVAYKSAHTELRMQILMYEGLSRMPGMPPDNNFGNKTFLLAAIQDIEIRILNSEKASVEKNQNGQKGQGNRSTTPPVSDTGTGEPVVHQ